MQKLNEEELVIGLVCGIFMAIWVKALVVLVAPLTAILWAVGGAGFKPARRFGVPILWGTAVYFTKNNIFAFVPVPFMMVILSVGYGLPSTQPPDEGSALGRFWWKIMEVYEYKHEREMMAEFWTRATIYLALLLVASFWSF